MSSTLTLHGPVRRWKQLGEFTAGGCHFRRERRRRPTQSVAGSDERQLLPGATLLTRPDAPAPTSDRALDGRSLAVPAVSRTRTASTLNLSILGSMTELSEQDRAILALEASLPGRGGEKERRARDKLGLSATAYYQQLNAPLD
jgi:hypothetical protein